MSKPDPGVALSLGSAFLGYYAHGGFLCGLNQRGVFPGKIAGASAGAMAAGFYASGFQGQALEEALLSSRLKRAYPDLGILLRWIPMLFLGQPIGLMSGQRMVRYLKKHLPVDTIEDCVEAQLSIAVTNIRKQESSILEAGPLAKSIMGSCSVPLLFAEQKIGDNKFFDGGILHENPIDHFLQDPEVHTIVCHRVSYPRAKQSRSFFVHNVFTSSHVMFSDEILNYRQREAERSGKRLIFLETEHPHPGLFQRPKTKKAFFDQGFSTGLGILDKLEKIPQPSLNPDQSSSLS